MVFWEISKLQNFRELVQDLMDSYEQLGCNMSLKNSLYIFTPGFLSIKLWCRERRTWGALPSRHFDDWSTGAKGNGALSC